MPDETARTVGGVQGGGGGKTCLALRSDTPRTPEPGAPRPVRRNRGRHRH